MIATAEETACVKNSGPADVVPLLSDLQFDWRIRISDSAKERFRRMALDVLRLETLKSTPVVAVVRRHGILPYWDDLQIDFFDEAGTRVCTLKSVKDVKRRIRFFA